MRDWKRGPLPVDYSQSELVPENKWDVQEISICRNALTSSGLKDRMELQSVSVTKDKGSKFYFFKRPKVFGATYVIQLNSVTHEIIGRYFLPDG